MPAAAVTDAADETVVSAAAVVSAAVTGGSASAGVQSWCGTGGAAVTTANCCAHKGCFETAGCCVQKDWSETAALGVGAHVSFVVAAGNDAARVVCGGLAQRLSGDWRVIAVPEVCNAMRLCVGNSEKIDASVECDLLC